MPSMRRKTTAREQGVREPRACAAPDCTRPAYARGLCQSHHRQLVRLGKLMPIRPYRKRAPGTVKLAGHRVSLDCAEKIVREAKRRGLSLGAMIAEILEDWHAKGSD